MGGLYNLAGGFTRGRCLPITINSYFRGVSCNPSSVTLRGTLSHTGSPTHRGQIDLPGGPGGPDVEGGEGPDCLLREGRQWEDGPETAMQHQGSG